MRKWRLSGDKVAGRQQSPLPRHALDNGQDNGMTAGDGFSGLSGFSHRTDVRGERPSTTVADHTMLIDINNLTDVAVRDLKSKTEYLGSRGEGSAEELSRTYPDSIYGTFSLGDPGEVKQTSLKRTSKAYRNSTDERHVSEPLSTTPADCSMARPRRAINSAIAKHTSLRPGTVSEPDARARERPRLAVDSAKGPDPVIRYCASSDQPLLYDFSEDEADVSIQEEHLGVKLEFRDSDTGDQYYKRSVSEQHQCLTTSACIRPRCDTNPTTSKLGPAAPGDGLDREDYTRMQDLVSEPLYTSAPVQLRRATTSTRRREPKVPYCVSLDQLYALSDDEYDHSLQGQPGVQLGLDIKSGDTETDQSMYYMYNDGQTQADGQIYSAGRAQIENQCYNDRRVFPVPTNPVPASDNDGDQWCGYRRIVRVVEFDNLAFLCSELDDDDSNCTGSASFKINCNIGTETENSTSGDYRGDTNFHCSYSAENNIGRAAAAARCSSPGSDTNLHGSDITNSSTSSTNTGVRCTSKARTISTSSTSSTSSRLTTGQLDAVRPVCRSPSVFEESGLGLVDPVAALAELSADRRRVLGRCPCHTPDSGIDLALDTILEGLEEEEEFLDREGGGGAGHVEEDWTPKAEYDLADSDEDWVVITPEGSTDTYRETGQ
ncbi:hypothetical protein EGW08_005762 [Elysia chlorotica]|uniref:Uncharacterized protein n=1 Tax=Elysia chlorotica TaxID=188477 RepID=A0A3S1C9D4_ELYCH|nr:hypothetical protein EGW08_005762 [Elysia chlorotica]